MAPAELFGLAAGSLTTVSLVPQAVRILRYRQTAGISLGMYVTYTTGIALWLVYGVLIGSPSIIVSNVITFVLSAAILALKLRLG